MADIIAFNMNEIRKAATEFKRQEEKLVKCKSELTEKYGIMTDIWNGEAATEFSDCTAKILKGLSSNATSFGYLAEDLEYVIKFNDELERQITNTISRQIK